LLLEHITSFINVLRSLREDAALAQGLQDAAKSTARALAHGGTLLVAGNGGSAADAQHLVAEFVGRFNFDRPAMRAVAITTDSSILTAVGNDYGFDRVFARQVEALGRPGDVFLGISTSGRSPNILKALELARGRQLITIGLSGQNSGGIDLLCDFSLHVPSTITHQIQECHLVLEHLFCKLVEECYFNLADA
jgi:D-sedoheptulose 7-phosphate isomerase